MKQTIIHVDMDAFFAAVEVRDNPDLAGKPLIIGALPHERGVVSTCSYEARKYGVHSAMSIKTAYRLCPHGIYMHPNGAKYVQASHIVRTVWSRYTDLVEYVSLDEGYLDVTGSAHMFGGASVIGWEIKQRVKAETGLTCSVGIGYSMASAKLASEEKKPDGYFEIPDAAFWLKLISERNVRVLAGVGGKTAAKLETLGIRTVSDLLQNEQRVIYHLGRHGQQMIQLARGSDTRRVVSHFEEEAKSISRETTFQTDTTDYAKLADVLRLLARDVSLRLRFGALYAHTVTLKVTYGNMQSITRAKSGEATNRAEDIYTAAAALLNAVERRPIRLVGVGVSGLAKERIRQLAFTDMQKLDDECRRETLETELFRLQKRFGTGVIKTAGELGAEKRLTDLNENP